MKTDRHSIPVLGLSRRERSQYSLTRAILNRCIASEGGRVSPGLEEDCSQALSRLTGRSSQGILVPVADLHWGKRSGSLSTGTGSALVPTLSGEFIEALRSRSFLMQLGARSLENLVGNLDLPRQTGETTAYWVSEGETIVPSNIAVDLVSLRPKSCGILSAVTRRLLMQSSQDVEAIVRMDIIAELANAIDRSFLTGAGGSEPLGILNTDGVGSVPIGTNGGPIDFSHLVGLETIVSEANADSESSHYLVNAKTRGKLKTTQKVTGQDSFLWSDPPIFPPEGRGLVNGYGAFCSNLVPSNLEKGTGTGLSAVIFGDFSKILLGVWGALEILPNPYGQGFPGGLIQLRGMIDADVVPLRPEFFAVCTDVVTT